MKPLDCKDFGFRPSTGVTAEKVVEKTLDLNRDTKNSHQIPEQLGRRGREDFGSVW